MKETLPALYVDGTLKLDHPLDWLENNCKVRVTVVAENDAKQHPLEASFGVLSNEDADELRRIIAEEFEQVEPDDWQ
jgi:hypothetical protein